MNQISILIVDDDFAKISSIIKQIREAFSETLAITQASSVQEAIENIRQKEFHLLITDFHMPLRNNEAPDNNGGLALLKSLYKRKTEAIVPLYIVGLTQYVELKGLYNGVWKVWHYDSSSAEWQKNIRDLIHHISLIKYRVLTERKESLFLEGATDKTIIEFTLKSYYETHFADVNLETIGYGAGASWVERQLFIWAKSLVKKPGSDKYLKAVGIFDDDQAGNDAIQKIRSQIPLESAESKTFFIIKNAIKYSVVLKSIRSKGLIFPTTIEDLFPAHVFEKARLNGWLIKRKISSYLINSEILNLKADHISEGSLLANGFNKDEVIIALYKVNDEFKVDFNKLVLNSPREDFLYISFIVKDALQRLELLQ